VNADAIFRVTAALRVPARGRAGGLGVPARCSSARWTTGRERAALILFLYRVVPSATLRNASTGVPTPGRRR